MYASQRQKSTFDEIFPQLQAALPDLAVEVGVSYEGVATHLIDIRNFYVVPLNLYRLMHIMERPGSTMRNYSQNSTVIYYSPHLNRHVRGKVNLLNPDRSCEIFAMDYGVTDAGVTPINIFNLLHPEAEVVPGLAQPCELGMCYPRRGKEFTSEAQSCFKLFMGQKGEALVITVQHKFDQLLRVHVMSKKNPDDVSTSLVYCNHALFYPNY